MTAVFKPDQRINSLGIIPQHPVMLLKLKAYIVLLCVKHRLINVYFTTAVNCFFEAPTYMCHPGHLVVMSSTI